MTTEEQLANKFERLIKDHMRREKLSALSMRELARRMTDAGYPISHGTLTGIRNGRSTIDQRTMESLCAFFGVPESYFWLPRRQALLLGRLADLDDADLAAVDQLISDLHSRRTGRAER
ncbi:helix-turn-helix domain-containing protein [Actinoalloteichus sp. GBA129-24]|uniref:helix-turn-helix domain-containing protein n=1 Tax=Actinoalloteichus sp. GBA129-24 TaxID=1612551 RepID=UPI0009504C8F|nr:helix-turn-helix transcriptional regulator [Actinoalloteichus sp. GBA129-24]APU21307.1 Helix-turn-helix protein [Actinoalloteichus sp. GBA129-24]